MEKGILTANLKNESIRIHPKDRILSLSIKQIEGKSEIEEMSQINENKVKIYRFIYKIFKIFKKKGKKKNRDIFELYKDNRISISSYRNTYINLSIQVKGIADIILLTEKI